MSTVNAETSKKLVTVFRGLTTLFMQTLQDMSAGPLQGLAREIRTTGRGEDFDFLLDFAGVNEWIDERTFNDFKAFTYRFDVRDWEVTIEIDRNDVDDNRVGHYSATLESKTLAWGEHRRDMMADLFNYAFQVTAPIGPKGAEQPTSFDGVAFISDSHPYLTKDGKEKTQSNRMTAPLTDDLYGAFAIMEARKKFRKMVLPNGRRMRTNPNTLVIPSELENIVSFLLTADRLPDPGNANELVPNPIRGLNLNVVVEEGLTSASAWFMIDSTSRVLMPFIYLLRKAPATSTGEETARQMALFYRKKYVWGADARYNYGHGFYQTVVGSTGGGGPITARP